MNKTTLTIVAAAVVVALAAFGIVKSQSPEGSMEDIAPAASEMAGAVENAADNATSAITNASE